MYKFKHFFSFFNFIFLFFSTLLLLSSSSFQKKESDFSKTIRKHHSYLYQYHELYYLDYLKSKNLIFSLNRVNHPTFLQHTNIQNSFSFKDENQDNHFFVNPSYNLPSSFLPQHLVEVTLPKIHRENEKMMIDKKTQDMYQQLYLEATLLNLNLVIFSAYRTYSYQSNLYHTSNHKEYIAKPGHSEHHTGEAIDIATLSTGLTEHFEKTKEYVFLKNNAHRFGFILRYPKDKIELTGYNYEPWHFRYVGVTIATYIYEHNITLEEYIYQFVEIY